VVVSGFQTAAGKSIAVTKESLSLAQEKLNNKEMAVVDASPGVILSGFQTAGGKSLTIKKDAMESFKAKLEEKENEMVFKPPFLAEIGEIKAPVLATGFQTAGGKCIAVKKESLGQAKEKIFENEVDTPLKESLLSNTSVITSGFQTGNGRSIAVRKEQLDLVKEKFDTSKDADAEVVAKTNPTAQLSKENAFKVPTATVPVAVAKPTNVTAMPRKVDNSKSFKKPQLIDKSKLIKYIDSVSDETVTSHSNDLNQMETSKSHPPTIVSNDQVSSDATFKNVRIFNKNINNISQSSYVTIEDFEVITVQNEITGASYLVKPIFSILRTDLRLIKILVFIALHSSFFFK
jgi:hypothetical protein